MDQTVSSRSLDRGLESRPTAHLSPEEDFSALGQFCSHAKASLEYNLVQAPINGIMQIVDHSLKTNGLPAMQIFEPPKAAKVGSAAWAGDIVGGTAAAAIPFIVFHKMVGPGAATAIETSAEYGLGKVAIPTLAKTAALGALYGGVLTPTSGNADTFWRERGQNAFISAMALTAMTAGSIGLKATDRAFLTNDVVASAIAGAGAGEIDADGHSLIQGHGLASGKDRLASIASWSLGSALGGGANTVSEFIKPSSGIRGVRTLADMTRLADTTIKPGHPERYAFEKLQVMPSKAELLTDAELHEWYNRSSSNLRHEIDNSSMPIEWKKLLVSGHQDLTYALDALANRPNPKPLAVVFGSARFPENDFRYQRARYLGGRLVQEGYDVITGGGPGTMEAVNRGAYEAGGTSIGVVLKLPHEQRGNGYQTLTLKHRNFFTRMETFKPASLIIGEEGGIGTGAEALDALTNIQCKKLGDVPVYGVGTEFYGHMDTWMKAMVKAHTVSPEDRNLYTLVDNPDAIFADLNRRKAAQAKAQKAAAALAAGADKTKSAGGAAS